jgi:hypothetical protein
MISCAQASMPPRGARDAAGTVGSPYRTPPPYGSFPSPTKCGQRSGVGSVAAVHFGSLNCATKAATATKDEKILLRCSGFVSKTHGAAGIARVASTLAGLEP